MTNFYNLTIDTQYHVPHDVLMEHIAVALRDLNFTGRVNIIMNSATTSTPRQHPFDGPEVFDDAPLPGEYEATRERVYTKAQIQDAASGNGMDVLEALAQIAYKAGTHVEGSFTVMPADPYPNVTRAISSLKDARRD